MNYSQVDVFFHFALIDTLLHFWSQTVTKKQICFVAKSLALETTLTDIFESIVHNLSFEMVLIVVSELKKANFSQRYYRFGKINQYFKKQS